MNSADKYTRIFLENEDPEIPEVKPKAIPIISLIITNYAYAKKLDAYWIVGSFSSFLDFATHVVKFCNVDNTFDFETEGSQISTYEGLAKKISDKNYIYLWSSGLQLKDPLRMSYSYMHVNEAFRTVERLEYHFTNAKDVIEIHHNGNASEDDYLVKGIENDPTLLRFYADEMQKSLIDRTIFTDRQKQAILNVAKLKGMI